MPPTTGPTLPLQHRTSSPRNVIPAPPGEFRSVSPQGAHSEQALSPSPTHIDTSATASAATGSRKPVQTQVKRWADITPSALVTPSQGHLSSAATFGMPSPLDLTAALERGPSNSSVVEPSQTWDATPTPSAVVARPVDFGMSAPSALPFEPQARFDGLQLQAMPAMFQPAPIAPSMSPPRKASPALVEGQGSSSQAGQQLFHEALGSSGLSETYHTHVKNTFIDFEDNDGDAPDLIPKSVSAPNVFTQIHTGSSASSLLPMQPIREHANSGHWMQDGVLMQSMANPGSGAMAMPYVGPPAMVTPAPPAGMPPLAPYLPTTIPAQAMIAPSGLLPPSARAPPNVPGVYPGPARIPSQSRGSGLHGTGRCRPCAWYWKEQGCQHVHECGYCHMCPEGELRNRKKAKVNAMRAGALQPQPVGSRPGAPRVLKLSPLL